MHIKELLQKKYGFLTITRLAKTAAGPLHVRCKCECGTESSYILENLERGKITSCGCINDRTSVTFLKEFKKRLWKSIEVNGECWVWKGLKRKDKYCRPYINYCHKQYNPTAWLACDSGVPQERGWAFVRQCNTQGCVNPAHSVKVPIKDMLKAITKEIKGEYLRNK